MVGTPGSCNTGTNIVRVSNGATYASGAIFDTTNANTFRIRSSDQTGVPTGTSFFQYSRTLTGIRLSVNGLYATTTTSIGATGSIDFFNLVDGAYGYYFVTNTNQFGSAECVNLVGSQLAFRTGSGHIGQNYQVAPGDSQSITAQFSDGFPYGPITWRGPDGRIITTTTTGYTITLGNGVSQLVIDSARSGTDYGTYTATASNLFGTVTASSVLSDTVVLTPPVIDVGDSSTVNEASDGVVQGSIGESFRAAPGETVTIEVNDIAGQESSFIRFYRSAPVSTQFIYITNNPAYTILTSQNANGFTNARISFTAGPNTYGTYRAQASNSVGSDAAISQVGQAPRIEPNSSLIRILSGQTRRVGFGAQINIEEGGTVILESEDIEGQPGRTFVWTYRNSPTGTFGPLPSSTRITQGVSGTTGTLTINNIDRTLYGEYQVVATNEFGSSVPVTTIVGAPPIIRYSSGTVTSGRGEIGNNFIIPFDSILRIIACVVGGYPPADPSDFRFEEEGVNLGSVQQLDDPNCFIREEIEFEITCGTTITTRTENIFGHSNTPSSRIVFPPPTIVPATVVCDQHPRLCTDWFTVEKQDSVQIGSQLCLHGQNSFEISCSVERTNIPGFTFQWLFNSNPISQDGKHTIRENTRGISVLNVTDINEDDTGRYGCRVISVCGETDQSYSNVFVHQYEYVCDHVTGQSMCLRKQNLGIQTTVPNYVCDYLNQPRPRCNTCNWIVGPWSSCIDTSCDRGRRRRQVICDCEGRWTKNNRCLDFSVKPDRIENCVPPGVRCGNL